MKLEEFLSLAENLKLMKETFPTDTIWEELEFAVRNHIVEASECRPNLVTIPSSHKDWQGWCEDNQRHIISGENVLGTIFYPKPIILDDSSTIDGSVYCNAELKVSSRVVINGDLVSRKLIDWRGELVRSLIAPEIHLDQAIHKLNLKGSILCKILQITPQCFLTGKVAGSFYVSEAVLDRSSGKPVVQVVITDGCEMGSIYFPCAIDSGERVVLSQITSKADVKIGANNIIDMVRGHNIVIGPGSHVNQITAQGDLRIEPNCHIHHATAVGNIYVGRDVKILQGIVASIGGEIIPEDPVWWKNFQTYHYKGNLENLLNKEKVACGEIGKSRSIIVQNLPHSLYYSLKQISLDWLSELTPVE